MSESDQNQSEPNLSLTDLALVLNLLGVSINRGAFERQELRQVLDVTDKLEEFLKYQATNNAPEEPGDPEGEL